MDEGQGRGTPAAHAGVRVSDRPQTPSRRQRVEGCSQSQGNVRSQNAGESRSSLSCKGASARRWHWMGLVDLSWANSNQIVLWLRWIERLQAEGVERLV